MNPLAPIPPRSPATPPAPGRHPLVRATVTIGVLVALALAPGRARAEAPAVAVAVVNREDLFRELNVQAEFRPYQEVDLHAKVSGYLKQIGVDIGDVVKAGDLIGVLEVPELDDDLARATAAVQRAEAEQKEAHLTHARLINVNQNQPNLIAQQELDTAEAKDSATAAAVTEAKADLEKYRTLAGYTRITAPFGGVITKRYADPGALIQAGTTSNTQAEPLIRLSENDRLRLDFPVTESFAGSVVAGDQVEIRFDSGAPPLKGIITRFTRRITMETRSMETEVEVPNPDLKLIPGMYATVTLKLDRRPHALAVPVEAVAGTTRRTVYVVNRDQKIEEREVKLGLETPEKFEVLSGLEEGDRVMVGNRAQVQIGEQVAARPAD